MPSNGFLIELISSRADKKFPLCIQYRPFQNPCLFDPRPRPVFFSVPLLSSFVSQPFLSMGFVNNSNTSSHKNGQENWSQGPGNFNSNETWGDMREPGGRKGKFSSILLRVLGSLKLLKSTHPSPLANTFLFCIGNRGTIEVSPLFSDPDSFSLAVPCSGGCPARIFIDFPLCGKKKTYGVRPKAEAEVE